MKLNRPLRWFAIVLVAVLVLFIAVALTLQYWVNSDDFRSRVEQQASKALGVPVKLQAMSIALWPVPAIALDQVTLQTQPRLTVGRVEIRPLWAPLLQRRLEIATLLVRDAVLPQPALATLAAALQKNQPPSAEAASFQVVPRKVLLENLTWINDKGQANTVDVRAQLGNDGWPTTLTLDVLGGRFQGAQAQLKHTQPQDPWQLQLDIGGGRLQGQFTLLPLPKTGLWKLQGQFDTPSCATPANWPTPYAAKPALPSNKPWCTA